MRFRFKFRSRCRFRFRLRFRFGLVFEGGGSRTQGFPGGLGLRLIDFVYHSNLGLRVKNKKRRPRDSRRVVG